MSDSTQTEKPRCWCGDDLVYLSKECYFHKIHTTENPENKHIASCKDFAHASFFVDELVPGAQPKD